MNFRLGLSLFLCVLTAGCDQSANSGDKSVSDSKTVLKLTLDVPVVDMESSSLLSFNKSCIVGVCWYEIDKSANDKNLPSVVFNQHGASFQVENVMNVSSVVNEQHGQSVQNLKFILRGLPDNSSHEKNLDFIYGIIQELTINGWHHYIYPSSPRISGSEAGKLPNGDNVLGRRVRSHPWFDPTFRMSLHQWLSYPTIYDWHFYQNGVYLTLEVMRHDSKIDPNEKGNYLVALTVQNESDFWRSHFEEKEMAHWVEMLPTLLNHYHAQRADSEAKARVSGIKIDETYQDPPIKALGQ